MSTPALYARKYIQSLSFALVPLPEGQKRPITEDWNKPGHYLTDSEEAYRRFKKNPKQNMGLLHGPSGTAALDVDHVEFTQAALVALGLGLDALLAANPYRIRGKKGEKPLYRAPEGVTLGRKKLAWRDPDSGKEITVFELRGGDVQDVLPPSLHPEGIRYAWVGEMPPSREALPELPAELLDLWLNWEGYKPQLEAACPWAAPKAPPCAVPPAPRPPEGESVIEAFNARYSVAELLERHGYQAQGGTRWLYKDSTTGEAGVHLLPEQNEHGHEQVYSHHGADPLATGHAHDAFSVFVTLEHGGDHKAAVKAAAQELGLKKTQAAARFTTARKDRESEAPARPEIIVNGRFLREIAADAERALKDANEPPALFRRAGTVARIDLEEGARIVLLDAVALKGHLDRVADFVKIEVSLEKGEDGKQKTAEETKPARPPADLAPDLLARVDRLPLPHLRVLATSPVFSAAGEVVRAEGYHPESGTYLVTRGLEDVRDDVPPLQALALLQELLCDFPFTSDAGFAHTLAALLLPFVRALIDGPTPLHLIEAPTRGSGKGLLSEVIAHVTLGKAAGVMVQPKDGDEFEKRVTSILLEGERVILLDNVHTLKGEALAAALTARTWKGRRLGKSEMLTMPNDALWLATGNNVVLDDDMPRRIIPIRLDPGVERPEERTGFRHENLLGWVKEHRAALVSACLSLASAWLRAGRPTGTGRLGSYESWAATIGGILAHANVPGFLAAREHLYDTANAEPQEWASLLAKLHEHHEGASFGARDVLAVMKALDVCADLWDGKTNSAQTKKVGWAVRQRRDRVFGGYRLRAAGQTGTGNAAYRVESMGEGREKTPETPKTLGDVQQMSSSTADFRAAKSSVFFETPKKHPQEHRENTEGVPVFRETPPETPEKHPLENGVPHSVQGVSGVFSVFSEGNGESDEEEVLTW